MVSHPTVILKQTHLHKSELIQTVLLLLERRALLKGGFVTQSSLPVFSHLRELLQRLLEARCSCSTERHESDAETDKHLLLSSVNVTNGLC